MHHVLKINDKAYLVYDRHDNVKSNSILTYTYGSLYFEPFITSAREITNSVGTLATLAYIWVGTFIYILKREKHICMSKRVHNQVTVPDSGHFYN